MNRIIIPIIFLSVFFIGFQKQNVSAIPIQKSVLAHNRGDVEDITIQQSLKEIIRQLEERTGYRVLYRDALIAGKHAVFEINDDWQQEFSRLLLTLGLDAFIDDRRRQIVIYEPEGQPLENQETPGIKLEGYVIDDLTGERLPFANIIMNPPDDRCGCTIASEKPVYGTQTNESGYFNMVVPAGCELQVIISYVGYHKRVISLEPDDAETLGELSIRLEQASYQGKEIVVSGMSHRRPADTLHSRSIMIGGFSPIGESSSIRMLQTLPSVSQGLALSDGAFVRGSNTDALQVLLDGSVIYNVSHLFGLVDSFNSEVIRTSSFHYDVTPARYQAPPGGTLSLITRTGSLHRYRGSAGVSTAAVSGSMEGPFLPGRSSWLVAGRLSLLNTAGWLGTDELIAWGLNIDRKNSLESGLVKFEDRIVTPGSYDVYFHDFHAKFFWEDNHRNRWTASGYSGFNNTHQSADRLTMTRPARPDAPIEQKSFETRNRWGNNAANIGLFRPLSSGFDLHARSGISYYHTRYVKEDFTYQRPVPENQNQQLFIHQYENQSELTHWYLAASVSNGLQEQFSVLSLGAELHTYNSAYLEESLNRPSFYLRSRPFLVEGYAETEWKLAGTGNKTWLGVEAGLRLHYFTEGDYIRLSPRLRFSMFPDAPVSPSMGYSRTYQFLYKLSFYNQTATDIWITANEHQKPSAADHLSAGVYFRPAAGLFLLAEAFYKEQSNLRFHEINIQNVKPPLEGAPWFSDNSGFAQGFEFQAGYAAGRISLTQSYTLSSTELSNPRLEQGERFFAYWDRRHQFNTYCTIRIGYRFRMSMNWFYATGVPYRLDLFRSSEERLGSYSRVDMSIHYEMKTGNHRWNFEAGFYNLLNRNNPWYRDWILVRQEQQRLQQFVPVQADIYDLGFQPSFSIRYFFRP